MIDKNINGFTIRSDGLFLQIGVVASFMACIGVYLFVPMFFEPISSPMDIFGISFLGLWLLVVLSGAIISFYRYSRRKTRETGLPMILAAAPRMASLVGENL